MHWHCQKLKGIDDQGIAGLGGLSLE